MRRREATIPEWTFALALAVTALWFSGILLAPALASRAPSGAHALPSNDLALRDSKRAAPASFAYDAYRLVCHQRPDRSLHLNGHPLAVCARCFGIYAGALFGLMIYPFIRPLRRTDMPHRLWLILALAPASIDFFGGLVGAFENTLVSRLVTGSIVGAAAAFYIAPGLVCMALGWRGIPMEES